MQISESYKKCPDTFVIYRKRLQKGPHTRAEPKILSDIFFISYDRYLS